MQQNSISNSTIEPMITMSQSMPASGVKCEQTCIIVRFQVAIRSLKLHFN